MGTNGNPVVRLYPPNLVKREKYRHEGLYFQADTHYFEGPDEGPTVGIQLAGGYISETQDLALKI
ncbi:hypothetical protein A2U01_0066866, partial [Trifolium medium]|nr:hypothetical protein [Trifolium medium]